MRLHSTNDITTLGLPLDYIDPICRENDQDVWIYHDDKDGQKHPIHKMCGKDYVITNGNCPVCNASVNISNVFTPQEINDHLSINRAKEILNRINAYLVFRQHQDSVREASAIRDMMVGIIHLPIGLGVFHIVGMISSRYKFGFGTTLLLAAPLLFCTSKLTYLAVERFKIIS